MNNNDGPGPRIPFDGNLGGRPIQSDLNHATRSFFDMYWKHDFGKPPAWIDLEWAFNGSIPNHDKQGCYAILQEGEIVYIVSGIGKGGGSYLNHGLGYRLKRYFKVNKERLTGVSQYVPTDPFKGITGILTIGFDNHYWLAAALEIYLINQLHPVLNRNHRALL